MMLQKHLLFVLYSFCGIVIKGKKLQTWDVCVATAFRVWWELAGRTEMPV